MKWVKVKQEPRKEYPQKIVHHEDGVHFHYENDTTQEPKLIPAPIVLLEDNGDGRYTGWSYSVFGAIGQSGRLAEGVEVLPLTTKADRKAAQDMEAMLARAEARSAGMYQAAKASAEAGMA